MRDIQTIEIPCGLGSLNGSKSLSSVRIGDLVAEETLTSEHDTWQKDGGATKLFGTTLGAAVSVNALHDFVSGSFVQELVGYLSDGRLVVMDSGGIAKTLNAAMGTSKFGMFAEGASTATKKLYFVNGWDVVQVYTGGASSSNLATPPADWTGNAQPTWLFSHGNRMIGGGGTGFEHRVYTSASNDMDTYTGATATQFYIYPGESQKIVGGVSWRGRAYFFKYPRGIYYLDDTDTTITNWVIKKLSDAVGCVGPGGIVSVGDEVLFLSPQGYLHTLSAVQEFGDARSSAVLPDELGVFLRENVNFLNLSKTRAAYYDRKKKALFAMAGASASVNNRMMTVDLHRRDMVQVRWSTRDVADGLCVKLDETDGSSYPLIGTDAGFVYKLDTEARTKDSAGYTGQWETPETAIFPKGDQRANLRELELVFRPEGDWDIDVEVHRDGALSETVQFNMQSTGAVLGSFTLDTDVLGGLTVKNSRKRIRGDCRRIKLIGRNNTDLQNFSVGSQLVKFKPGNTR